jgi:hypothetical protein
MKDFVTTELVAYCDDMCEEHGEVIFNNASLESEGAKKNDNRRRQLALSKMKTLMGKESLHAGDNDLNRFEEALRLKLRQRFENHHADSMVVLLSQENCKAQLPHTDYSDVTLRAQDSEGLKNLNQIKHSTTSNKTEQHTQQARLKTKVANSPTSVFFQLFFRF